MTKVLLVDDEATLVDMLQVMLEAEGYEVLTARDGQTGLDILTQTRPDIVLSDVMMPRLDGWGLYRAMRADPACQDIPVILMSAGAELSGQDAAEAGSGPPAFIRKPFDLDDLLALLARTAGRAVSPRR